MKSALMAAIALSLVLDPVLASAQPEPPPPGGPGQPPPGYQPGPYYGDADVPPPEGFNGSDQYDAAPNAQQEDRMYADAVQRWSAQKCVDQRNSNPAAGAVIGGVFGALLGS